ncbi:MAG: cytochrome P450, partial [Planctomycetota bacterium]
MILRHADVREAAKDWETFSSDAPFRVPIPSEESVRTIRQLPIETDPPLHTQYREITKPFFERAKKPEVIANVRSIVDEVINVCLALGDFEAVQDLALPIQSRALTTLLNVPESEADTWIGWGIHVFKVTGGEFKTGNVLEAYLNTQLDRAEAHAGDDFFSALVHARMGDRRLTREECLGYGNLAFAGGRDTIIHTATSILAYLGRMPEKLLWLREDPSRITLASEEFFRVYMPLTQIGRVCPRGANVRGVEVKPGDRIGLCWA